MWWWRCLKEFGGGGVGFPSNTSRHHMFVVLYLAVKGEYPQTSAVVNTAIRPGRAGPLRGGRDLHDKVT